MSPSRIFEIGPPSTASGVMWMAAGTLPDAPDMRPSVSSATLKPAILEIGEGWGELVKLGHAQRLGAGRNEPRR
jgi:hypothetical protein